MVGFAREGGIPLPEPTAAELEVQEKAKKKRAEKKAEEERQNKGAQDIEDAAECLDNLYESAVERELEAQEPSFLESTAAGLGAMFGSIGERFGYTSDQKALAELAKKNAEAIALIEVRKNIGDCDAPFKKARQKPRRVGKRKNVLKELKKRQIEQAYLLQNMKAIAEDPITPDPSTLKNLILVERGGDLMTELTISRKLSPMFNALPVELSSLTPYLKMYRRDRDEEGNIVDKMFKFASSMPDVLDLFRSNKGLGNGVGLKSFRFETTGKNIYSAPRTLIATMNIYFQSVSEFFGSATGDDNKDLKWAHLLEPPGKGGKKYIPGLCPSKAKQDYPEFGGNYDEYVEAIKQQEQAIKSGHVSSKMLMVETGWTYTKNNLLSKEMEEAIDKSKMVFSLMLNRHQFNFNEDGSIDLEINFNSALEAKAEHADSDILSLDVDGKNKLTQKIKQLEGELEEKNDSIGAGSQIACTDILETEQNLKGNKGSTKTPNQKAKEKAEKEIEALKKELVRVKKQHRVSNYGRFVQNLLKNDRLFRLVMSEEQYEEGILPTRKPTPAENKKAADRLAAGTIASKKKVAKKKGKKGKKGKKVSELEVRQSTLLTKLRSEFKADKSLRRGQKAVYFFYFGDLMEYYSNAVETTNRRRSEAEGKNPDNDFRIILGDFEIYDYKRIKKCGVTAVGTRKTKDVTADNTISQNLANLPISLDLFSMWFANKMINGGTSFSFKQFVDMLMPEVTSNALSTFVDEDVNLKEKTIRAEEGLPIKVGITHGYSRLLDERSKNHAPVRSVDLDSLAEQYCADCNGESPLWLDRDLTTVGKAGADYMVLYSKKLPRGLTEINESENAKSGIYHFKIGTDRGIVKSISLERVNNAAINARNIMHAYGSVDNYGLLQEPYNATVTVYGGAMFMPGQHIYINPTGAGLGTGLEKTSLARSLGMGGFYLITKVTTDLEAGMLESKLECRFVYYGELPGEVKFKNLNSIKLSGIPGASSQPREERIEDSPFDLFAG